MLLERILQFENKTSCQFFLFTYRTKGNLLVPKKLKNAGSGLTSQQTQQNQQTQLASVGRVAESDADDADVCSLPVPGSPFSPSCSGSRKSGKADHSFFEDYIRNDKESTDRFAQVLVASTSSGSDASLDEVDLQVRVWASLIKKHVGKKSVRKILQDMTSQLGYMLDESEAEMATSAQLFSSRSIISDKYLCIKFVMHAIINQTGNFSE
ncbi:hypothetical protein RvY_16900 [Ramazzottius varieornatus]|uniref:Uncharacterized protein n=1 Tax=Ramazzottius varieornatus TaxID=947166 RepID=A0A1D1W046_RAMVA|nr:hypothetical protein RvY_16900 [Ramazzottius varieornatus]